MARPSRQPTVEFAEILAKYDESLVEARTLDGVRVLASPEVESPGDPAQAERLRRAIQCLSLLELDRRLSHSVAGGDDFAEQLAREGETVERPTGKIPAQIGRFQILRRLGVGGFGMVFLAADPVLCRLVALKVPRPDLASNSDLRRRFVQESQVTARLNHPHLVPIFDAGQSGAWSYQVMEYCSGGSLAALLRATAKNDRASNPSPQRTLPISVAVEFLIGLADGVEYAHRNGILHRDLKPANILLSPRNERADSDSPPSPESLSPDELGQRYLPRIADFGLARLFAAPPCPEDPADHLDPLDARRTQLAGTPQYMAPEQLDASLSPPGPATDVYGLGTILYELLCGVPVFAGANVADVHRDVMGRTPVPLRELRPEVPRDLEAICLKCLAKQMVHRYASAGQLADELRAFRRGEPILARHWPIWEHAARWSSRRPMVAALVFLSVCLLLGLLGGGAWHVHELDRANSQLRGANRDLRTQTEAAELARRQADKQSFLAREHASRAERLQAQAQAFESEARHREYSAIMLHAAELFRARRRSELSQALQEVPQTSMRVPPRPSLPPSSLSGDETREFVWRYLWGQARNCLNLTGHSGHVRALAVSSDRRQSLSIGEDDTLRFWDLLSGRQLDIVHLGSPAKVTQARFNPTASRAILLRGLFANELRECSIWDTAARRPLWRLEYPDCGLADAAVSPNGQLAAVVGDRRVSHEPFLECIQVDSGQRLQFPPKVFAIDSTPGTIASATFTPDNATLIVSCSYPSGPVWISHLWSASVDSIQKRLVSGNDVDSPVSWNRTPGQISGHGASLLCSPSGTSLAVCSRFPDQVAVVEWPSGIPAAAPLVLPAMVDAIAFANDERLLVGGHFQTGELVMNPTTNVAERTMLPELTAWDWRAGKQESFPYQPAVGAHSLCAVDSEHGLLIGENGGLLTLFRPQQISPHLKLAGHQPHEAWGLAFSPDSRRLYSVGDDAELRVWDLESQTEIAHRQAHTSLASCIAVSPDGRWVATGGYDDRVVLWDASSLQPTRELTGHTHDLRTLAFSPDSQTLASGGRDETVRLWDVATGATPRVLEGSNGTVRQLRFSTDGDLFVAFASGQVVSHLGGDRQVVWSGLQEVHALEWQSLVGPGSPTPAKTADRGGSEVRTDVLLIGDKYGAVRCVARHTGEVLFEHTDAGTDVRSIALSPDGRTMAVAGDDQTVRLWYVPTWQSLFTFPDLGAPVHQVAFSPDGQWLAAALHDGTIRLWRGSHQP